MEFVANVASVGGRGPSGLGRLDTIHDRPEIEEGERPILGGHGQYLPAGIDVDPLGPAFARTDIAVCEQGVIHHADASERMPQAAPLRSALGKYPDERCSGIGDQHVPAVGGESQPVRKIDAAQDAFRVAVRHR